MVLLLPLKRRLLLITLDLLRFLLSGWWWQRAFGLLAVQHFNIVVHDPTKSETWWCHSTAKTTCFDFLVWKNGDGICAFCFYILMISFQNHSSILKHYLLLYQGFRSAPSSAETSAAAAAAAAAVIRPVEAKDPALLFKQQLTAYVEKIFGMIRDNLKNELQALLSLCIQVG